MLKHLLLALSVICLTTTTLSFEVGDGPVTYTYKTVGNLSIQADVYVPKITVRGKHPVVLAIHGGGYVGGAKSGGCSGQELNEMLSRGWLVVSIDYRLAPYSHLADMVQDVQDAYAWIRTELVNIEPLDLNSFIVLGGSAGGGLAVISGYMLSPRPQAIIAFYPGCTNYTDAFDYNGTLPVPQSLVTQMEALMQPLAEFNMNGTDPRSLFFNNAVANEKTGWMISSNDPNIPVNTLIEYLQNYSAVYHINSTYPPTVLIHGFDDTLVPHQQSVLMASYLKKANVPYKLNLVPGAGHGFDFGDISVQVWDDYILTAFNFAEKYLASSSPIDIYDIIQ